MNWKAISFDWNQIRAFLATAEEGSLSAAARVLESTQPTLSRQVSALERDLGVTLFERGTRAMDLTEPGMELLEHVRAMGEAATRVSLAASGQSQDIEGQVSITATDLVATHHLPTVLERVRGEAPGLTIEVIASNEIRDLQQREADIAIRNVQPLQGELIARRVGVSTAHLVAAPRYLDRAGRPQCLEDLADHQIVGVGDPGRVLAYLNAAGASVTTDQVVRIFSASGTVLLALLEHGFGLGMMPRTIIDQRGTLEVVLPDLPTFEVPVWLVTHRELHTSRRIRLVFGLLADELERLVTGPTA